MPYQPLRLSTTIAIASVIVLVALFAPVRSEAQSCNHQCQGRNLKGQQICYGGCSLSLPTGCAASCYGGSCSYNCKGYGSRLCREANSSGFCERSWGIAAEPPSNNGTVEWSVVQYSSDGTTEMTPSDLNVVASSSMSVAPVIAEAFRGVQNENIRNSRQGRLPKERPETYSAIYFAPSNRKCTPVTASFKATHFPESIGDVGAYVKGTTDGTNLISLDVLYARDPMKAAKLALWAQENLEVQSQVAVEWYGWLAVGSDRSLGYMIAGAAELP